MPNCTLYTIEDGIAFGLGADVRIVNHGAGDVPIMMRNTFANNHLLVESGHGPTVQKINIQTPGLAHVGIVWLERPNEILLECVGGTPSVSKEERHSSLSVGMRRKFDLDTLSSC